MESDGQIEDSVVHLEAVWHVMESNNLNLVVNKKWV